MRCPLCGATKNLLKSGFCYNKARCALRVLHPKVKPYIGNYIDPKIEYDHWRQDEADRKAGRGKYAPPPRKGLVRFAAPWNEAAK